MNQCHANRILDCAVSGEQTLKDRSSQLQGGLQIKLPFQRLQKEVVRGGLRGGKGEITKSCRHLSVVLRVHAT